jgi:hypothetical protein
VSLIKAERKRQRPVTRQRTGTSETSDSIAAVNGRPHKTLSQLERDLDAAMAAYWRNKSLPAVRLRQPNAR